MLQTSSYDYTLPPHLIATHPAEPKESAKLLVYDRSSNTITHTTIAHLLEFIPLESAIIFNDTKVIKARLFGHKTSGGKCELLINKPLDATNISVYIKGRVRSGSTLKFGQDLIASVIDLRSDGSRVVQFYHQDRVLRFEELLPLLDLVGHTPLPPYIDRADTKEDEAMYQSVFAKHSGAVAAPTASLHFSDDLFAKTTARHTHAFVTLHIGSGTFKPVECENILDHPMHSEFYTISSEAKELIEGDKELLCVGTTSTRSVEYFVRHSNKLSGEADLFLHPQNPPTRVDHLLTNFHLPRSTLLMLVASFVGLEKAQALYAEAVQKEYRFYSYGDAMLIL